jgi:preprotein translocase subunit SecA
MLKKVFGKIFATQNDKEIKKYKKRVELINALEEKYSAMSDEDIQKEFNSLKEAIQKDEKTLDEVLNDSFAMTREASKRILNMRHFDVQLIGGMALHEGRISEMKTGEGKTLVATLAVILNAMTNKGVHVVTVNDYLALRDATDLAPLYNFFGYNLGVVTADIHDDQERKSQYDAHITYGTNNEFGFDYLRDNMKYSAEEQVQSNHNFAIVDEVDSILIDEARTPLIISGESNRKIQDYAKADEVAKALIKGEKKPGELPTDPEIITEDFALDEKNKVILMSDKGIAKAEELFGVENMFDIENAILSHNLDQALKANYLFEKDVDYVKKDGEIVIVDEFTGRLSEGRRFSDGLHQALEAKEKVEIKKESQTLADITFQNYFRHYDKLAGMTGTAQTEATEFAEIYGLDVISIPTNVPISRLDNHDLIYKTEREKFEAVVKKILEKHKIGQPVLIGTASIEKSEQFHEVFKKEKIAHNVLNAKNHTKEAEIIANAGVVGAITIATNMAGRGVDIKLSDEAKALGGLCIIGTERHESRRIDNQLRGRSGRQGDPGESTFYLSLEDNLMRIFGSERIQLIMEKLGIEEGEHIESGMVTRAIENAQKKVETMHFESRKHLLEYDDVANKQRVVVYQFRNNLLNTEYDIASKLDENRTEYVANLLANCEIYDGMPSEDFNTDKVKAIIKEDLGLDVSDEIIAQNSKDELEASLKSYLDGEYEKKMEVVDSTQRSEIERILYLQILDDAWREHLYSMDTIKAGIGLRGYNQKDPLTEYKKESFNMFMETIAGIKTEIIKLLFRVRLVPSEEEEKEKLNSLKNSLENSVQTTEINENIQSKPAQIGKRIARNDPCPCGSGKKYKQCCGKSGPKRGVLAKS